MGLTPRLALLRFSKLIQIPTQKFTSFLIHKCVVPDLQWVRAIGLDNNDDDEKLFLHSESFHSKPFRKFRC